MLLVIARGGIVSKPHGHVFNADLVCSSCGVSYRHKEAPCVPAPQKLTHAAARLRRREAHAVANPFSLEEIKAIERALGRRLKRHTANRVVRH